MIEAIFNASFITSSCFSFLIFVFTLTMYRSNKKPKLFSSAFLIILVSNAVNYIFLNDTYQMDIGFLSTSMFSLYMLIVILFGRKDKNYKFLYYLAYIFAAANIVIAVKYNFIFALIKSDLIKWIVQIGALALVFLFTKTEGSKDNQFKRAIALLLFSKVFYSIEYMNPYLAAIGLCLEVAGYVTCYSYFYNIVYSSFMDKVNEAEKLKNTVERSLNYEVKKRTIEIEKSNEKLIELSKIDSLTKAYNKLAIMNIIEKLTTSKERQTFSILMFDIDKFKTINDTFGHVTGDMCIRTLTSIAQANIRSIDYLGRYGGDEFIIVLPALSTYDARIVAERFRSKVAETNNPRFTVSIGIATFPEDGNTVKELISAADSGLYRAKERGRNAVSHSMLF